MGVQGCCLLSAVGPCAVAQPEGGAPLRARATSSVLSTQQCMLALSGFVGSGCGGVACMVLCGNAAAVLVYAACAIAVAAHAW